VKIARTHRYFAAFLALALCAGFQVATWQPLPALATTPAPDTIATFAGGVGSGVATLVGQQPNGLAVHGSTLYIADDGADAVRALDLNTGLETVVAGGNRAPGCSAPCPATSAFIFPQGLATDAAGNLYIADFGQTLNGRVWKVDLTGTLSSFAGGGPGCTEPCPATQQSTMTPADVTVDGSGNVYFADQGRNKVSKVDGSGTITTIAGNGTAGYSGDGGLATSAQLNGPLGVALNAAGDIYISDYFNHVVRKVDHTTTFISTIAGGGGGCTLPCLAKNAYLDQILGLRLDGSGNVYVADRNVGRVYRVDTGGTISDYAGCGCGAPLGDGGPAVSASVPSPVAVAFDSSSNLFISDFYGMRVRRVDNATKNISTAAGTGTGCGPAGDGGQALAAQLCHPTGMSFDSAGNLYFADVFNGRVREITPAGVISTVAGGGPGCTDPCAATSATLNQPNSVAVDASGNVFIADTYDQKVREVNHLSGQISTLAGTGVPGYNGDSQAATAAQLYLPYGVAVDSSGNVYIADFVNQRVREVDHLSHNISTVAGTGIGGFSGDGGPGTSAMLSNPISVAVDASGNLFILDSNNFRVRRLSGGTISTYAGGPGPACPTTIAVGIGDGLPANCATLSYSQQISLDAAGRLFIVANGNSRLRVVSTDGYISTIAGCTWGSDPNCPFAFADGAIATNANIGAISVAVDSSDNTFIGNNSHIYRVQVPVAPSAPTAVSAVAGDASATITWVAPASSGGNQVYRYTVTPFRGLTPLTAVQVTGLPLPTSTTINVANGASYTFQVTASNAFAMSAPSTSNAVVPAVAAPGHINTHAGSPGAGPARSLGQFPLSLAANGTDVYVGDFANPVVRDVNVISGQEIPFAGNDAYGYSGDGGAATAASINGAGAIAHCASGITYIADTYNFVVREIDAAGRITTVAGTGVYGYSGDGGLATSATLSRVFAIGCRGAGGFYIVDSDNGAVRIVDSGGIITTFVYGFSFPTGLTGGLGPSDLIYVADGGFDNAVWYVDPFNAYPIAGQPGHVGNSGDGGHATSALLSDPRGLALTGHSLYIADSGNHRIRVFDLGSLQINAFAGTGTAGFSGDGGLASLAMLNQPIGLAFDGGNLLYVADTQNFRVRAINMSTLAINTIAGNGTLSWSGDGGLASQAQLGNPYAIAVDAAGNQYVADNQNSAVRKIDRSGIITTVAGTGVAGFSGNPGPATNAMLNSPQGVAVDTAGDLFISDAGNQQVRKVDAGGTITTIAGTGIAFYSGDKGPGTSATLNFPRGLALDSAGNLYIADAVNNRVRVLTPAGTIDTFAGNGTAGFGGDTGPATSAKLNLPSGVAVDASDNVYISDSNNNRVRKVDHVTHIITTVAGFGVAGELNFPFGLAFDPAGNLFIADTKNNRVRVMDKNGVVTTVVGACGALAGFSGDGGLASLAHVYFPFGVATDASGDLFIADVNNNRVRGANGLVGMRAASCQGPPQNPPVARTPNPGPGSTPPLTRLPELRTRLPLANLLEPAAAPHAAHPAHPGSAQVAPAAAAPAVAAPPARTSSGSATAKANPVNSVRRPPSTVVAASRAAAVTATNRAPAVLGLLALIPVLLVALAWRRRRSRARRT
jgi:sugar lactone lactonase YvrE